MPKKTPAEVLNIAGRAVQVTNPDKPYFSRDVKLDVDGLAPGTYPVIVNGKQTSFSL